VSNDAPQYVSTRLRPNGWPTNFVREEYSHAGPKSGSGSGRGTLIAKRYDMKGATP
jgi:hypothetical protein